MTDKVIYISPSTPCPVVTIVLPIYNAGIFLRDAVMSIIGQTFESWELLLIDDGSTDGALDSIADIVDDRIRILRDGKNKGLAARLNEAIDIAQGRYFARMDQDDVSYPDRIARQVETMQEMLEIDLLATRAITIDENNAMTGMFPSRLSHDEICARPWMGFYFPHPTWFGTLEWFRNNRYAEPAPYLCEDQEFLLRNYQNYRFATLDEILFAYRIRSQRNPNKLVKTHNSVRRMQSFYFFRQGEWISLLLVQIVFAIRMFRDILSQIFHLSFRRPGQIDAVAQLQWHIVRAKLTKKFV
jgi:glycosyltransferase involved in cell wall biosynthesis